MRVNQGEPIPKPSPVHSQVRVERNGFFTDVLEVRELDTDEFSSLSANDFSLAAVIASNAMDFLKPNSPMSGSNFVDESAIISGFEEMKKSGQAFEPINN